MTRRILLLKVVLVLFIPFAAGCGSGGSSGSATQPSAAPTTSTTPTGTSGFTFRAEGGTRAAGLRPAAVVTGSTTILAAIAPSLTFFTAADGLSFSPASGTRPAGANASVSLVNAGSSVRMYFVDSANPSTVLSAIGDGLNFTVEPGTRGSLSSRQQPNAPKVVALPSGGFRAYYRDQVSEAGVIRSARSDDGLTFTEEAGDRLVGTSGTSSSYDWALPTVAPTSSGYLMVLVQLPRLGGASSLFMAQSLDGLSWTVEPQAIQTGGSDPVLVATGADQFRLYYTVNGLVQSGTIGR